MRGADDRFIQVGVREHSPNLFDQSDERRVSDDTGAPETVMNLRFRHDTRRRIDEERQQVERLRREMQNLLVT